MNHIYSNYVTPHILLAEMKEYEATKRLKPDERKRLRKWVSDGNSVFDNPYLMTDDSGRPLDYINAIRITADMRDNPGNYCW